MKFSKSLQSVLAVAMLLAPAAGAGAVTIETVPVGNPGNAGELSGAGAGGYGEDRICGAVDYTYNIGTYEVTNGQYAEFLNAVAASDPNGLYNTNMASGWNDIGGITRSGAPGSYTYATRPNRGNRPVNWVSWYDTLRFANWMHNGQPPGVQDASTTEDGAYDMSLGAGVVRKPGAQVFLPTEDEWYKSAYYKGGGTNAGYWDYPTASNTAPTSEAPPGTVLVNGSANYGYAVGAPYYTTEVGAYTYKPSDSAYGTFDQGGNLFEWNEADVFGDGSFRGLRGGSFRSNGAGYLHAAVRDNHYPTTENFDIGFRVSEVSGDCPSGGDSDGDGVPDGSDNCPCYYNPDQTYNRADFDQDCDVDVNDFLTFSTCFNGSLNPPNCP